MKSIPASCLPVFLLILLTACEDPPQPRVPAPPAATGATTDQASPALPTVPSVPSGNDAATEAETAKAVVSTSTDDPSTARCGGVTFRKPVTWGWITPTMQFRTLQYTVPGQDGAPAADLIFSVFPSGGAGPIPANLDRWEGQFRSAEGVPARSERSEFEVAGSGVSFIELEGSYAGMGAAAPRPGWSQLGAIIQTPGADIFVRLLGPSDTVLSNTDAFMEMIKSMTID